MEKKREQGDRPYTGQTRADAHGLFEWYDGVRWVAGQRRHYEALRRAKLMEIAELDRVLDIKK